MTETPHKESDSNGRQPYISFRIPFIGMEIKFGGRELFSVILLVVLATPIIYTLIIHDNKMAEHMEAQIESTDALTYVITLPQEERIKLNLTKPKRIREMERNSK